MGLRQSHWPGAADALPHDVRSDRIGMNCDEDHEPGALKEWLTAGDHV
jgi:hypothetical protein